MHFHAVRVVLFLMAADGIGLAGATKSMPAMVDAGILRREWVSALAVGLE
ncbi:protein of unknown function (plasmid) [Azospirillum baldaniorum]|uniref:Uncharacterized protein n=1 Tax=Azospirillum baldaniorum TaxID=1064539 RepID=A0A9P1JZR1_9PROT|nr:protein of unknown function [Azospirillum baldaniorum]